MLRDIGFVWAASNLRHTPWETRFRELCEYKERHGKWLTLRKFELFIICPLSSNIGYFEGNPLDMVHKTE